MLDCPECGGFEVSTESVTEKLNWGRKGDNFVATFPIRHCSCGFSWQDQVASEAITLAQFKYEIGRGIERTRFCNETERRLWELANTGE